MVVFYCTAVGIVMYLMGMDVPTLLHLRAATQLNLSPECSRTVVMSSLDAASPHPMAGLQR